MNKQVFKSYRALCVQTNIGPFSVLFSEKVACAFHWQMQLNVTMRYHQLGVHSPKNKKNNTAMVKSNFIMLSH